MNCLRFLEGSCGTWPHIEDKVHRGVQLGWNGIIHPKLHPWRLKNKKGGHLSWLKWRSESKCPVQKQGWNRGTVARKTTQMLMKMYFKEGFVFYDPPPSAWKLACTHSKSARLCETVLWEKMLLGVRFGNLTSIANKDQGCSNQSGRIDKGVKGFSSTVKKTLFHLLWRFCQLKWGPFSLRQCLFGVLKIGMFYPLLVQTNLLWHVHVLWRMTFLWSPR